MKSVTLWLCGLITVLLVSACDQPTRTSAQKQKQPTPAPVATVNSPLFDSFAAFLELKIYTDFSIASQKAQDLDKAISVFLYNPNDNTLLAAQDAWRDAYDAFLYTLVYANLPLPTPSDWVKQGTSYKQTLEQLDSWPIEGGYIDFVQGYPFSGIVNDLTLTISAETLNNQHGFADPSYASLGYHVLEFMLFGEKGQRLPSDFSPQDNTASVVDAESAEHELGPRNSVQNQHRRRQFLQLVSEQLQRHLHRLQSRWEPTNGFYAQRIQDASPKHVVTASLRAIQQLISEELLAKRLNGNSSEFSNSSHEDVWALTQSIEQLLIPSNIVEAEQEQWQSLFAKVQQCNKDCRQYLVEMLSLLKKSADRLEVRLPEIN